MNPTAAFRHARDLLLEHRTDYEGACRNFEWPRPERFNWALDWFDQIARGNERIGLRIVGDGGFDAQLTFDQLRQRSNSLAAHLRSIGVELVAEDAPRSRVVDRADLQSEGHTSSC